MNNYDVISNQSIAGEILDELYKKNYKGFTLRPYNFHKPTSTLWWLVPSADWPSYKHGKLALYTQNNKYRIGLNIEKGISNAAGQMLSSKSAKKLCIKQDWAWYKLINDFSYGIFEERLNAISKAQNQPLKIIVQASAVTSEYDPYTEKVEGLETDHIITFEYKDGSFVCLKDETQGMLEKYRYITSVTDLSDIFNNKEMEWFWVDFFVVFEVDSCNAHKIKDYAVSFINYYNEFFI